MSFGRTTGARGAYASEGGESPTRSVSQISGRFIFLENSYASPNSLIPTNSMRFVGGRFFTQRF